MIDEIDYTQENEITCPYCGDKNIDSWEVGEDVNDGDLGLQECGNCEKKFTVSRNMKITYTSYPTPCQNGDSKHEWKPIIGIPKEYFENKRRCAICGEEKIIAKAQTPELSGASCSKEQNAP